MKTGQWDKLTTIEAREFAYIYDSCIEIIEEVSKWCIIIGLILLFLSLCL